MTSSAILIPARFASTRLPGKPLAMLGKKTMIRRVYDACIASKIPTYVLTDSMQVYNQFNANTCFIEEKDYENGISNYSNNLHPLGCGFSITDTENGNE